MIISLNGVFLWFQTIYRKIKINLNVDIFMVYLDSDELQNSDESDDSDELFVTEIPKSSEIFPHNLP